MNNKERELLKIELDDIGAQYVLGRQDDAFLRLMALLKVQLTKTEC